MRRSRARSRLRSTSWPETSPFAERKQQRQRLRYRPMAGGFSRSSQITAPMRLANLCVSLAFCPESYSSRRIFPIVRHGQTEGNPHEKGNRVCSVGAVADFFRSDGGGT